MTNVKIIVQYDGTAYSGWQVQIRKPGGRSLSAVQTRRTVQGEIEERLKKIFQQEIKVTGASRTDAGVHALGQTANFEIEDGNIHLDSLQHSLNSMLPADIVISKMVKAAGPFNARYSARSKIYEYSILNSKYPTVLNRYLYWHIPQELDFNNIRKAAGYLKGKHDFTPFSSTGSPRKNNFCTIKRLEVKKAGSKYVIIIESDFFLYRMVRNIVGFLVHIGRGQAGPECAKTVLLKGKYGIRFQTAPARGLCLIKVKYQ